MKKIAKWVAIDGTEFNEEQKCIDYENLISKVKSIEAKLPSIPDTTDFSNGDGYIQHDEVVTNSVRVEILELCKGYIDHKWVQQSIDDSTIHPSYVARLLDDYNIRPISNLWYRFHCIDKKYREWGQPYFAANPDKAPNRSEILNGV